MSRPATTARNGARRSVWPDRPIPYDESAEKAIVGAMMYNPAAREEVLDQLTTDDFYLGDTRSLFEAIRRLHNRGLDPDPVSVHTEAGGAVRGAFITDCITNCAHSGHVGTYAAKLHEFTIRRALRTLGGWMDGYAVEGHGSAGELVEKAREEFDAIVRTQATTDVFPELTTLTDFLESHEDVDQYSPWLIEGLIREQWKLLIVGKEGSGKSTLLRMLAVAAAGGVHPFTLKRIPPVCTLIVDLENPYEAITELCRPMHDVSVSDKTMCWLVPREQGLDLRSRADRVMLESTIAQVRPQLVVMGPVYKMVGAVSAGEETAAMSEAMFLIDRLRVRYNVAFVLEHHAPHNDGFSQNLRPSGTSLWKRWPHMGLAMTPVLDDNASIEEEENPTMFGLTRFRGDRVKNEWPKVISRSTGPWPFQAETGISVARY